MSGKYTHKSNFVKIGSMEDSGEIFKTTLCSKKTCDYIFNDNLN